jgi:hypothetical protein
VSEAVAKLVVTGAVRQVRDRPFIVSPLGVVPKGLDKLHLILDLRYVNGFLDIASFKYESIKEVIHLAKFRDFLFTVDLKTGYHHVDIDPQFWQFLGFEWKGRYYVFCQLPFGLATGCYVFAKILKQLVQYWRRLGIRIIPYIDNFLFICSSASEYTAVKTRVLADFAKAGFVLSEEKCQLELSHVVKFLRFVIDTLNGVFHLTALQKTKLREAIASCLCHPSRVPAKLVARVTGLITSMSLVTGPVSGLFSRFLYCALNTRRSWSSSVALDESALSKLAFWQSSLDQFSSRPIWPSHSLICVLFYDAGADGWGGHLVVDGVEHRAQGFWLADERHGVKSSTWRGLEGLYRLLTSVVSLLRGYTVIARGDALNVFFILYKGGSRAEHLQEICLRVFWFCHKNGIELLPEWIPRDRNQLADYLSKLQEVDDFGLRPEVFQTILRDFWPFGRRSVSSPVRTTPFFRFLTRSFGALGPLV